MGPEQSKSGVDRMRLAIEQDLRNSFEAFEPLLPRSLCEMIFYHLGWSEQGGRRTPKRIRPLLTVLICDTAGGPWERCLPAASSIEFVHNFTLIHDDIEDRSLTRRGLPTVWAEWGIAKAINAGDALFTIARLTAQRLKDEGYSEALGMEALEIIDRACLRLTVGQHEDLAFEERAIVSEAEYLEMIEGKTSSLLAACAEVGALLAHADRPRIESFRLFGHHLGLAFQILDDILGIWGAPDLTGKPAGDDLRLRKKSLPAIYGLNNSSEFAEEWSRSPDDDLSALTAALDECGALAHSRSLAEHHTSLALSALQAAKPSGPSSADLATLTRDLLQRQR